MENSRAIALRRSPTAGPLFFVPKDGDRDRSGERRALSDVDSGETAWRDESSEIDRRWDVRRDRQSRKDSAHRTRRRGALALMDRSVRNGRIYFLVYDDLGRAGNCP